MKSTFIQYPKKKTFIKVMPKRQGHPGFYFNIEPCFFLFLGQFLTFLWPFVGFLHKEQWRGFLGPSQDVSCFRFFLLPVVAATGWSGPSEGVFCFRFFPFPLFEVVGSTGWSGAAMKKERNSSNMSLK